ncbi:MAG: haloalkane dehalogenase [Gammaproteobacteria bacterium]
MSVLRTPDDRFANLPGYSFEPRYVDIDGMRMHYVDEGPADGDVVLMLHGEPSWSYLYRHMIPVIAQAGFRAIAPDLIGFGRSDKLSGQNDYTYAKHVSWMKHFLESVDLTQINLVCQDWGSLIGLRLAAENQQRFSRIVLANGGLPTGDQEMPKAFKLWQKFARFSPVFPIGKIINGGCTTSLTPDVIAAYDAPFPGSKYKAAARAFPKLVPTRPDDPASAANRSAWEVFSRWDKPFLTAFSNKDPITRGGDVQWQTKVPGAKGRNHKTIQGGGHFLQEDKGEELAQAVIDFIGES